MDVRMMSLYVNLCGMILNAYIHLPTCLQLAWMLRERVFLRFDFYVLIVPINFCKLCELASHVGVLSDMFLDFSSFPFLRAFFFVLQIINYF